MMQIIDTHSHLYLEDFNDDITLVISRAIAAGVSKIFLPNIDRTTITPMLALSARYPGYCYPMIGLHPTSVKEDFEEELAVVEQELLSRNDYIAVGEIGLDLYWDKTFAEKQLVAFDQQIKLALKYDLPIVVHSREAFEPLCEVISGYTDSPLRGVFHSFTGTAEEVRKLLGFEKFMIGVNGVVTFKNSTLPCALELVPPDRLLIETDAPYLTPVPYRGKRNESAYLYYTLQKIAEVYKLPLPDVARQTVENSLRLFSAVV